MCEIHTINCYSVQVEPFVVMVAILVTPCHNMVLVHVIMKKIKFKLVLKLGVSVLFNVVYMHPVKWK